MPSQETFSSCCRWSTFLWLLTHLTFITAQTVSLSEKPPSPVVGQEVTFMCTASQDITTDTQVFYRRNTLQVGWVFVNSTSCTSVKTQGGHNYTFTCGSFPVRQVSLTIPADAVTEDEHGTDWRCDIFLGAVSNTVQLTLRVPVSTVNITTDGGYQPSVTISAGNTRTFTCTTAASRPVARLSWFRGGNNITDQAGTSTDQDMGDDKYTRQQSLTITGRVNDVDSGLKCEAVNIEGRTSVSSQTYNVIVQWEPQTDPILARDPPTTTLTEGVSVTLTCRQAGGKPLVTLIWSGVCSGTTKTESSDTTVTSRVQLSVTRTYNGQTCTCESRHPANSYLRSLNETFLVLFGPDEVHFSGISGQLTETTPMNLVCSSNESNPVPTYTWMNGSSAIPVTSSVLEFDGVYNGKRTSQTWSTPLSRYDDGVVVTCVVTSPDRSRHVSATTTLNVLYQPYITVASAPSSPAIEGRQLTLTCDVDSNPDSSGTWSRPVSQPLPGTTQTDGVLVITSVSRHDDGTYRCTATNSQKTNLLDIDITVHYPPDQMTITYNNITYDDEDANRHLRCSPDGNPQSFTFSKWQHISVFGQLIRELDGVTIGQESVLTIPDPGLDTRYQDTGYYVCRVENGVSNRNNQLVFSRRDFFNVKAPPVYGLKTSVFPGQKETSINISIPFYSTSGLGMVELSRNQSVVSNRFVLNTVPTNVSLTFHGTNITVGGFTTEISVQTLQQEDFGNYTLQVTNDVGVQQFGFYIKAAGPPDAPTDLQVTERAVNSIRVEWTAGFDGGSPQQFIVEYATGVSDWMLPQIPHSKTMESAMIENLKENTFYRIRLSARNSFGSSSFKFTNASTTKTPAFGLIIGGAVGGVAILILVPVVLIILYKRRMATEKGDNAFEMGNGSSPLTKNESGESSEDGMKKNVLYESAGPREDDRDGMKNNILYESAGPSYKPESGLYAEVNEKGKEKRKVEPSNEYAVVSKQKDTGKNDLYAEVIKPKGKEAKGKGKEKKQGKGKDTAQKDGKVYENMDPDNKETVEEKDNVYANADCKPQTEAPKPSRWKNIDGLEYTDVVFKEMPGEKNGKPIIHGQENRTEYIEVDFSKRAEPLPIEDEEETPKGAGN